MRVAQTLGYGSVWGCSGNFSTGALNLTDHTEYKQDPQIRQHQRDSKNTKVAKLIDWCATKDMKISIIKQTTKFKCYVWCKDGYLLYIVTYLYWYRDHFVHRALWF